MNNKILIFEVNVDNYHHFYELAINLFREELSKNFKMKDIEESYFWLGIHVQRKMDRMV